MRALRLRSSAFFSSFEFVREARCRPRPSFCARELSLRQAEDVYWWQIHPSTETQPHGGLRAPTAARPAIRSHFMPLRPINRPFSSQVPLHHESVYLDGLVLQNILEKLEEAKDLGKAAAVSKALRIAAQDVASDSLLVLLKVRPATSPLFFLHGTVYLPTSLLLGAVARAAPMRAAPPPRRGGAIVDRPARHVGRRRGLHRHDSPRRPKIAEAHRGWQPRPRPP